MEPRGGPEFAIDVRGLGKSFAGRSVVDDFSIRVRRGHIFGFLGPNGSGKTTTIRLLCGLLTPDAGEGTCLGFDLRREAGAIKRRVGYMTQRFSLYEDLSVRENLEFVARIYALDDRPRRVDRALERLGLLERQSQLAGTLSGGWKQRLALSACLLHEPELLLLDEPTAGVDPKARREFWDELHLLAAQGLTVLVSTHYMDEAERCHEIAYIAFGKLLLHGPVEQVRRAAGLTTWAASGPNVTRLATELAGQPGIEIVAPFGAQLHVSGTDAERMAASLARHRDAPGLEWRRIEPGLEDVFIHTMRRARDNFR
ncbi:MAG TPA: ABC transporter ATP-binding protein [Alphaproteobacteria bacterium]|nr:ABC transporter ATP-binding protein [Alphaproteobacteria bacterium]